MKIPPFATEAFYELYEFSAPHMASASDCDAITVGELLALAGAPVETLLSRKLSYGPAPGDPELRAQIASSVPSLSENGVVVVNAPEEGIFIAMHTLLEPRDRVVCMTPCYDSLRSVAEFLGCDVSPWPLATTPSGWAMDLDELARLARGAKLVVANLPHNPTGYMPSRAEFAKMCEIVEVAGARLFSDEMYRGLEMPGVERLPSAVELSPRAVALSGLSKAHGLPGLRAGWLTSLDRKLCAELVAWKHYTSICAPGPVQVLARIAVEHQDVLFDKNRALVAKNDIVAREFFSVRSAFTYRSPRGGSIALVETPYADAEPLCHTWAKERGVVVLPGRCLGAPAHTVRVGLGRSGFPAALSVWAKALGDPA